MAFFRALKRAFGFSDNGDERDDELDGINGERAVKRPYVNPFKNDDAGKDVNRSGADENDSDASSLSADGIAEQLLTEVIAIVNQNLPPFVVDNLDVDAERKAIGDSLKPSVDAFVRQVRQEEQGKADSDKSLIAELQEKLKTTEAQRRAVLAKYNDMQNKVATLEAEREQFELENKSLLNKIKVMKVKAGDTDFSDIDQAVASMDSSKKELEALTQEYQAKMEITNALLSELRADAAAKAEEVKKLNQELVDAKQQNEELANQVTQLEKQLEDTPDSELIDEVQSKIEQFEQFKIKKKQEISELKQQLARFESSPGNASDEINEFKQRNEELQKTIDKLNRQVADDSQKRNRRDIEVANQYNDLKTRYNNLLKQLEDTQAQVEQLNADASVTQDIVNEMSRKNETITLQYRDASAMLTLAQDELEAARKQIADLEALRDDLQQQIINLKEAATIAEVTVTPVAPVNDLDLVEPQPSETPEPAIPSEISELSESTKPAESSEISEISESPEPVESSESSEISESEPPAPAQSAFDGIDDIDWLLPTPPSSKPKVVEETEPEPGQPKKKSDNRQMSLF